MGTQQLTPLFTRKTSEKCKPSIGHKHPIGHIFTLSPPPALTLQVRSVGGPLDMPRVQAFMRQLLTALAHIHARGIIHRDIKCACCTVRCVLCLLCFSFSVAEMLLVRVQAR